MTQRYRSMKSSSKEKTKKNIKRLKTSGKIKKFDKIEKLKPAKKAITSALKSKSPKSPKSEVMAAQKHVKTKGKIKKKDPTVSKDVAKSIKPIRTASKADVKATKLALTKQQSKRASKSQNGHLSSQGALKLGKKTASSVSNEQSLLTVRKSTRAPAPTELPPQEEVSVEEVVLTDAEGRRYCRVRDCDQIATIEENYCRYHYLVNWTKIQARKKILSEGKLEQYIQDLTVRLPDKYLEMLRRDLRSEREFLVVIQELEIDDTSVDNEYEDEARTYIEEVRGVADSSSGQEDEY